MKRKILFLILTLLASGISGCGYGLVGRGASLPPGVRTIAVPTFTNTGQEPGIERTFTQSIREEFNKYGRLKVANSRKADWIIKGEIKEYHLNPVSFDSQDNVSAYRIEMRLHVKVTDTRKKKIILDREFHPNWDYKVTSGVALSNLRKLEGIENAARDFGQTLTSLLIEGF